MWACGHVGIYVWDIIPKVTKKVTYPIAIIENILVEFYNFSSFLLKICRIAPLQDHEARGFPAFYFPRLKGVLHEENI